MHHRWYAFQQLLLARLREFYRQPEAIFWVYGFPVLMTIGLGIAFANREPEPPQIDLIGTPGQSDTRHLREFLESQKFKVHVFDEETATRRLTDGSTPLVIDPRGEQYRYLFDPTRSDAVLAYRWVDDVLMRRDHPDTPAPELVSVTEPGNRYIDFLVPGLMGLNLMGGGLWGVGFVVVDMRIRKLLKRMLATPMRRSDYLFALMTARLVFLIPDMLLLLGVGWFLFGVPVRGSLLALLVIILIGAVAFSGIGLLVASRAETTETVSGLMNLIMLPMWLLSGTFFSAERFPEAMQPVIQALPLTQLNNALREVMLQGFTLTEVGWRLGILALWGVGSFLLALRIFRWT